MIEGTLLLILFVALLCLMYPMRVKFYIGNIFVFLGYCPKCKNKITFIKNYWVCPSCNKRG